MPRVQWRHWRHPICPAEVTDKVLTMAEGNLLIDRVVHYGACGYINMEKILDLVAGLNLQLASGSINYQSKSDMNAAIADIYNLATVLVSLSRVSSFLHIQSVFYELVGNRAIVKVILMPFSKQSSKS